MYIGFNNFLKVKRLLYMSKKKRAIPSAHCKFVCVALHLNPSQPCAYHSSEAGWFQVGHVAVFFISFLRADHCNVSRSFLVRSTN